VFNCLMLKFSRFIVGLVLFLAQSIIWLEPANGAPTEYYKNSAGEIYHWQNCRPIGVRADLTLSPKGSLRIVQEAVLKMRNASGLPLEFLGTTQEVPSNLRKSYGTPFGTQIEYGMPFDTQIEIAWTKSLHNYKNIGSGTVGMATNSFDSGQSITSSSVLVLTKLKPNWSTAMGLGPVLLHELGHSLGLDHSSDKKQLMYPTFSVTKFGKYDLIGLKKLGTGFPCTEEKFQPVIDTTPAIIDNCDVRAENIEVQLSMSLIGGRYQHKGIEYGRGKNSILTKSLKMKIPKKLIKVEIRDNKKIVTVPIEPTDSQEFALIAQENGKEEIFGGMGYTDSSRFYEIPTECSDVAIKSFKEIELLELSQLASAANISPPNIFDNNGKLIENDSTILHQLNGVRSSIDPYRICDNSKTARFSLWVNSVNSNIYNKIGTSPCAESFFDRDLKVQVPNDATKGLLVGIDATGKLIEYIQLSIKKASAPEIELTWYQKAEGGGYVSQKESEFRSLYFSDIELKAEFRKASSNWIPAKVINFPDSGSSSLSRGLELPDEGPVDIRFSFVYPNGVVETKILMSQKPFPQVFNWGNSLSGPGTSARYQEITTSSAVPLVTVKLLTFDQMISPNKQDGVIFAQVRPGTGKNQRKFRIPLSIGQKFYVLEIGESPTTSARAFSPMGIIRLGK